MDISLNTLQKEPQKWFVFPRFIKIDVAYNSFLLTKSNYGVVLSFS